MQTLETRLVFTTDASRATPELRRLQDQVKGVDRAAQEARKNLERMPPGQRPGQQTYAVQGPSGASISHAAAMSVSRGGYTGYAPGAGAYQPIHMQPTGGPRSAPGGDGIGAEVVGLAAFKKLLGPIALAVAAVKTFTAAMEGASKAISQSHNPLGIDDRPMSGIGQQVRPWFDAANNVPLLGPLTRALAQNRDKGQEMGEAAMRQTLAERAMAQQPIRFEAEAAQADLLRRGRGLRWDAVMGADFARAPRHPGVFGNAMDAIRSPAERDAISAIDWARANVDRAKVADRFATSDVDTQQGRLNAERAKLNAMPAISSNDIEAVSQSAALNPGAVARLSAAIAERKQQENVVMEETKRLGEALNRNQETRLNLAQKEHEMATKKTDQMKVQLSLLDQELQKGKGQAAEFGMTNLSDRRSLFETMKEAKEKGFAAISEAQRRQLAGSSATAGWANEQAEILGQSDPYLKAIREMTGQTDLGNLKKRVVELREKVEIKVINDEAATKKAVEEAFTAFEERLKKTINDTMEGKMRVLNLDRIGQRAIEGQN